MCFYLPRTHIVNGKQKIKAVEKLTSDSAVFGPFADDF